MDNAQVVLLSGGVESSTLLAWLASKSIQRLPLFIDYGQRAAAREVRVARAQCLAQGIALTELDMSAVGKTFRDRQVQKRHVPLPHRNLVLLSLALGYADEVGAQGIALALIHEDTTFYPSAGEGFLETFRSMAATLSAASVDTPFIDKSKREVIELGVSLGVDYSLTYSCLIGRERHCGVCPQCRKRRVAFEEAGVFEGDEFYLRG